MAYRSSIVSDASSRISYATSSTPEPIQQLTPPPARLPRKQSITAQDRPLNQSRGAEIALASWAFLFSEIIIYSQRRISGIVELEQKLSILGYRIGIRLVELLPLRDSLPPSTSRSATGPPRHISRRSREIYRE